MARSLGSLSVDANGLTATRCGFYLAADGTRHFEATFECTDGQGNVHKFHMDDRVNQVTAWSAGERTTLLQLILEGLTEFRQRLNLEP